MNTRPCLTALMAGAMLFLACGDEEVVGGCDPCPPAGKSFQALTTRESVLNNLELSYNGRVFAQVDSLLDSDFTFYFLPGDVGGNIPSQWGRAEETAVTMMLFDPSLNEPPYPPCRSIRMDLKLEDGVQWVEVIPQDFPSEIWYTTTLPYDFTFEFEPDQTYTEVPGSQAQLTVRNSGTDDAPQWRLVEWRDLPGNSLVSLSTASTETTTWGGVKAIYAGAILPREHVLGNLEASYNRRDASQFSALLDDNFTFFFSPGDVGGSIPEQWGRVQEMTAASRLLDRYLNDPNYPTCRSIRMDLKFEDGVQWVEVIPEDFPTEKWYTTTVYYEFTFEMNPDMTYIAVPGSQAQFTVRNAGTGDAPQWRLVEWRDLASNSLALVSAASTQTTTWGGVKALYR